MSTQQAGAKGSPDLSKLFNDAQQSKFQIHNMSLTFAPFSFDYSPLQEHLFYTVMCFRISNNCTQELLTQYNSVRGASQLPFKIL